MIVKHLQDSSSLKSYLVGLDKSFWLNESELLAASCLAVVELVGQEGGAVQGWQGKQDMCYDIEIGT